MTVLDFSPYSSLSREKILHQVRSQMSQRRFDHCLRVEKKIMELATLYGADATKASLAALIHDYAKERPLEELQELVVKKQLSEQLQNQSSEILHGPVGAEILKDELDIQDEEILDAIREHTIGGTKMTLLSKCLFVADAIEDGRNYPGVEEARVIANHNIDEAVRYLVRHTLQYLIEKEVYIYPGTLEVYNYLVIERGNV